MSIGVGLFDERRGLGVAGRLVIREASETFWSSPADWTAPARDAIRAAHRQASTRVRGVPHPLHRHSIDLLVPGHKPAIDGPSLGLPAALAFMAHWTGAALPEGLAATGALHGDRVVRVGGLTEKVEALREAGATRMLVPAGQGGAPGLIEVATLDEAIAHLGWDTSKLERPAALATVRDEADRLCKRVRQQNLSDYKHVEQVPAWMALGDELLLLSDLLEAGLPRDALEARCYAALAYAHTGSLSAHALLSGVPEAHVPPPVRLLHATMLLATAMQGDHSARVDELATCLTSLHHETPPQQRAELDGITLGTLGRARMHARELQGAEPLLTAAAAAHRDNQPWESGRSLVYLAACQRLDGRPAEALETLSRSRKHLVEHTRPYDPAYYRSCLMFWFYEAARSALDAGDPDRAYTLACLGISSFEAYGSPPWPGVGLHRTAAWACRAKNWQARADRHQSALDDLVGAKAANTALERIQQEARGEHRLDGEVY